jgi:polysaccharide biosynthesis/export protein
MARPWRGYPLILIALGCFPLAAGEPAPNMELSAGGPIPWQAFAQGEYVGPARGQHVIAYQLRVDDEIEFFYHLTREELAGAYPLEVGDVIRVESLIDAALTRDVVVQVDGTADLLYLGPVRVVRKTVEEIRKDLNQLYKEFYRVTDVNVSRVKTQTKLQDLLAAVDGRCCSGRQSIRVRITPEGTVSLPAIGVVPAQGLTLDEMKREVDARYREIVAGLEVTPILTQRAPRYIFVVGEVRNPGRYDLRGPTTAMQSIALAGGWKSGGNLGQIVVFRRADDWGLVATKLDIRGALSGADPSPADEIWLRDSDLVVVPKSHHGLESICHRWTTKAFPVNSGYECVGTSSTLLGP